MTSIQTILENYRAIAQEVDPQALENVTAYIGSQIPLVTRNESQGLLDPLVLP